MTTLTTYTFSSPATAPRLARRLEPLRERGLPIGDAAVVEWAAGEQQPTAWQTEMISDRAALSGAFWGLLFAHLFLLPLSHVPSASQPPQDDHTLAHLGIGQGDLHTIRGLVTPGSSALFVIADERAATDDEPGHIGPVTAAINKSLAGFGATRHHTAVVALSPAHAERLYIGFGRHQTTCRT